MHEAQPIKRWTRYKKNQVIASTINKSCSLILESVHIEDVCQILRVFAGFGVRNADTGNPPLTIFDVAERVQIKSVVAQQMISVLV